MAEPIVSNISVDHSKISALSGHNIAHVSFQFDISVVEYSINVNGTSNISGVVAGHGVKDVTNLKTMTVAQAKSLTVAQVKQFTAATTITDQIDNTELSSEGSNRVNIYGKSTDGTWSTYNQP